MLSYTRNKLSNIPEVYSEWGWRGYPFVASTWLHRQYNQDITETCIWERDWDLLVVLDTCRVDWMESVAPEYPYIDDVDSIWSVGSHSEEWLRNTFAEGPDDELRNTAYVSANHFTERYVTPAEVTVLDELTDYLGPDSEFVVPPAHMVTDRAIDIARTESTDRLVVHYMQPHKPFFERNGDRYDVEIKKWSVGRDLYRNYFSGEVSLEQLRDGFIDNLRYVLDEVSLLLDNVDADTAVLTADHGQALGERFLWDHRPGVRYPKVRQVPWVETTAMDRDTVEPQKYDSVSDTALSIEERLEHLGYK